MVGEVQLEYQVVPLLARLIQLLLQLINLQKLRTDVLGHLLIPRVQIHDLLIHLQLILRLVVALTLLQLINLLPQLCLQLRLVLDNLALLLDFLALGVELLPLFIDDPEQLVDLHLTARLLLLLVLDDRPLVVLESALQGLHLLLQASYFALLLQEFTCDLLLVFLLLLVLKF